MSSRPSRVRETETEDTHRHRQRKTQRHKETEAEKAHQVVQSRVVLKDIQWEAENNWLGLGRSSVVSKRGQSTRFQFLVVRPGHLECQRSYRNLPIHHTNQDLVGGEEFGVYSIHLCLYIGKRESPMLLLLPCLAECIQAFIIMYPFKGCTVCSKNTTPGCSVHVHTCVQHDATIMLVWS